MLLERYLFRTLFKPFIFSIFGCSFLLIVDFLSEIVQNVVLKHIPFFKVMEIISYDLISLLTLSIPMGIMIGMLVGYSTLSTSNEIIAFKSLGVSIKRIIFPAFVLGAAASIFLLIINQFLTFPSYKRHINLIKEIAHKRLPFNIEPKRFINDLKNYSIYINDYDYRKILSKKFIIFKNGSKSDVVIGEKLSWQDGEMVLENAEVYQVDKRGVSSKTSFELQRIPLKEIINDFQELGLGNIAEYYSLTSLYRKMTGKEKSYHSSLYLKTIFHWKSALIFSPIIFALLSALLSIGKDRRAGKGDKLTLGLTLLFLYWLWIMYGRGIIDEKIFKPYVVMWAPNIIYLLLTFLIYFKRSKA